MAHTRIRKFNTKDTYPEQKLDNDLCQAVVARGRTVFLRGQIAQDLETRESLHIGDAGAQASHAMSNIKMLMEEAGGGMEPRRGLPHRHPSPRGGLPRDGQMAEGRLSGFDRAGGLGIGKAGMAGRDRSDRRDTRRRVM